ncbi:MAG: hypothetical protein R3B95_20195 [Nitrospirales bacterium]|nr:hypothetical protein [Nitrospirales bacterium]
MTRMFRSLIPQNLSVFIIFVLFVSWGNVAFPSVSYGEALLSTSHGLDLSQLHLVVDVPHEYYERLYERVRTHLKQAGLFTKSANTYIQGESVFRVTLEVEPLEGCPDHFLYTKKLEVQENVVPERIPKIRAWAVTWSLGSSVPEVRKGQVTLGDLEKDIDELMRVFLMDFQYANQ